MQKLTLAHLSAYLPYKLRVKTENLQSIPLTTFLLATSTNHSGELMSELKPILRPLSDLLKVLPEIIKDLCKIDLAHATFECDFDDDNNVWWINASLGGSVVCSLQYDGNVFSIYYRGDETDFQVFNPQHEAQSLLAKYHIDYQDLIELGLAIELNSLNK